MHYFKSCFYAFMVAIQKYLQFLCHFLIKTNNFFPGLSDGDDCPTSPPTQTNEELLSSPTHHPTPSSSSLLMQQIQHNLDYPSSNHGNFDKKFHKDEDYAGLLLRPPRSVIPNERYFEGGQQGGHLGSRRDQQEGEQKF